MKKAISVLLKFFFSKGFLFKNAIFILFFVLPICSSRPAFAVYSAAISTASEVTLNLNVAGDGVGVKTEPVNVNTTCKAGYNLSVSTSSDNKLYLDGDDTSENIFNPINSAYALSQSNNINTWGISLSNNPNTAGAFFSLSDTPIDIKTPLETASETDIDDTFNVYYGAQASNTLAPGQYAMADSGVIVYYLTIDSSCADSAEVSFLPNAGNDTVTNMPVSSENTLNNVNHTITLSNKTPARTGYTFKEWNLSDDGTGDYYYPGQTIAMGQGGLSGFTELYAIWVADCAANSICYDGNHQDAGTMDPQTGVTTSSAVLTPSNFSRAGYGFAGWNTKADGTGTNYGPNQTIDPGDLSSSGLTLFARWVEPTGNLQTWAGASTMSVGDLIALKDNRDDEVYAVAKLADNNVWIVENLRLNPGTANITNKNTNNPTSTFVQDAPGTVSTTTQCSTNSAACDDQIYFYTGNMNRSATQLPTGNTSANAWYSYGTMYNWYTATAGHGTYSKTSGSVAGDICPSGWHLPTGGSGGEYPTFTTAIGGTGNTGATNIRKYPNNFIWSGDYNPQTVIPDGRGTQARLWQATAANNNNAYRMGFNSSTITPTNTYNKWDNFAVRCIYQGGNIPYAAVTVNFLGTGITGLTFTNNNYGTETATPGNPTVSLVENATYTATAITTAGYEVSTWTVTTGGTLGDTTTSNPAPSTNTFTATADAATITITGNEIPIYNVTVNLGAHVNSVSFSHADYPTQTVVNNNVGTNTNNGEDSDTISLRRGVIYTLTSTYETGYTIDAWVNGANSTLGNTTSVFTTFTITGASTLSLSAQEADELTYTLTYNAGSGTDAPDSETLTSYNISENFTITNSAPIYYGYTFNGWTETNGGSTVDYVSGDTLSVVSTGTATTKTLYAVYTANSCPAGKICYFDNGADVNNGGRGTMANKTASSNSSAVLIPSNYSKSGYGFAGWATSANATPYGPNATITTPDIGSAGLALYAKWVKSTGYLHTWNGCNALSVNEVTALTDIRDGETYAVAKLGDNNCWIIENLRLVPSTANITNSNTHNPASGFSTEAANSSSSNTLCGDDGDTNCNNQIQYNTNSLDRNLTQSDNTASSTVAWYSYGVYYNWYTATAGNGLIATTANTNVAGDICPAGWHLPTGHSGEWVALNSAVNSGNTSPNLDLGLRAYPVNLLRSGDYNKTSRTNAGTNGRYWTSTGYDGPSAYRLGFQGSSVTANGNYRKWDAFTVRCIYDGDT